MEQEELARESMRVLAWLDEQDRADEENRQQMAQLLAHTIPPPPRMPTLELDLDDPFPLVRQTKPPPSPPQRMKDMRVKLAEAWVLLTEVREAVHDWKTRSHQPTRLRPMEARLDHAISMVDDAILELEPKREKDRPTWRP